MDKSRLSPTAASSLAEWLSYLENSHFKAIDLGLARVQSVAQQLDLLTPAPFASLLAVLMAKVPLVVY